MMENYDDDDLLELPPEQSRKKKINPEEEMLKKSEMARRRKDQNEKKEAEIKEATIQKLLKRQASKNTRATLENDQENNTKKIPNKIRYRITTKGTTLSYPNFMTSFYEHINVQLGVATTANPNLFTSPSVKPREKCCIVGCPNYRKYNHSVTKQPVCSLACYKKIKI